MDQDAYHATRLRFLGCNAGTRGFARVVARRDRVASEYAEVDSADALSVLQVVRPGHTRLSSPTHGLIPTW